MAFCNFFALFQHCTIPSSCSIIIAPENHHGCRESESPKSRPAFQLFCAIEAKICIRQARFVSKWNTSTRIEGVLSIQKCPVFLGTPTQPDDLFNGSRLLTSVCPKISIFFFADCWSFNFVAIIPLRVFGNIKLGPETIPRARQCSFSFFLSAELAVEAAPSHTT